jgi:[ribosomal protein S18]-alanine N-acetyltransferase
VILRAATAADVSAITDLERLLFAEDAWSANAVTAEISAPDRAATVAAEDTAVLGYAVTLRSGDVADLHRIGVHPDARRRGIARALLDRALRQAADAGATRMLLEVGASNDPALAFYADAGFAEIDRRRRYYRDGSDALVLQLPLAADGVDTNTEDDRG